MNVQNLIDEGVALFENKKFDEAIEKLNQALDEIEDKNSQTQEQNEIQAGLGLCYLEQAKKVQGKESEQLFGQAVEHFQHQLSLAEQLADKQNSLQQQTYAQSWLGRCFFEQAMKAEGKDAAELFEQAVKHRQQHLSLAEQLADKQNSLQQQTYAQSWLGRCFFEQAMKAEGKDAAELFEQAVKHRQQQLRLAEQLADKQDSLQEQINAQSWLGGCYFEQAMKAKGKESKQLFGQAVEHHQQQLRLAEQLADKQNSLQQQSNAQSWLGRCYLEQAMKAKGKESEQLFGQAVEHFQRLLEFAEQLADKQNSLQQQTYAQSWLGRCFFEQAMKAKGKESEQLFGNAIEHFQQSLEFAKQLADKQNSLQEQNNAQFGLGRCYLEQAMKAKGKESEQLFGQAVEHFQQSLEFAKQLADKPNSLQQQTYAQSWLGRCYFAQAIIQKNWERYFDWKKQKIQGDLFGTQEGTQKEKTVIDDITTILAVLNIPPMELGSIPLAHYTSPSVCERLFGIVSDETNDKTNDNYPVDKSKVSPMRIGSSTYMNDPTEGEGLLELLNLQDLELENKADCPAYNAFFTCFSSRVNDLNQFRLYGKENGVEASGCCLVFNKSGDWLKEPDISASFRSFTNKQNEGFKEPIEADVAGLEDKNLPLYQVAYIAYYDEYIAKEKCGKWLLNKNNQSFGIRLKPIGKNPSWHQFRIKKLEEALIGLIEKSNNISDENSKALEYIRYLFKDFAFRDEEEFRLLKIEQIGSDNIKYCQTTKSVYLPYADIRDIVDEVILGTNYEKSGKERKAEVFQHLMRKHYPNVKVSRSSLPINANPPIKKD